MIFLFSKNRRNSTYFIGALAVLTLVLLCMPEIVYAQGATDKEMTTLMNGIMAKFNLLLDFLSPLAWMIIYMIGGLFDNELIFGGNMGEALLNVWVQVRNIVNVFFVLILLVIAIYNVLGLGESGPFQNLQLKQVLPKFVISLIIVNFSFLGCKVFIDFTNVITQAVFALPSNITSVDSGKMATELCTEKAPFLGYFCDPVAGGGYNPNEKAKQFFAKLDSRNLALAMSIDFGKLHQQKLVAENVKDVWQLVFNILFGIVINVMYLVCFLAVLIVLIARIAVLWVCVALSPFLALNIIFPNILQSASPEMDLQKNLVKHATAPITIGIYMSIGYIMMDTLNKFPAISGGYFSSLQMDMLDPNALTTGIANIQQFLVSIGTVYVVFTGVFAAAGETMAGFITNEIKGTTLAVGQFFAKLPLYAQIAPVAGAEGVTPMQLINTLKGLGTHLDQARGGDLLASDPNVKRILGTTRPSDFYDALAQSPGALRDSSVRSKAQSILGLSDEDMKDNDSFAKAIIDKAPSQAIKDKLGPTERDLKQKMATYQGESGLFAGATKGTKKGEKIKADDFSKRNAAIRKSEPSIENKDKELSSDNKDRFSRLDANIRSDFQFVNTAQPEFDEAAIGKKLDAVSALMEMMRNPNTFTQAKADTAVSDLYQPELLKTLFNSNGISQAQRSAVTSNSDFNRFLTAHNAVSTNGVTGATGASSGSGAAAR